ncbi:phosphate ABC transporter permease PstA [Thiomicrorhabdus sp. ZW0627]|uniref:phosphate ABC transporter permease PstA n=1 Tax=Thiomicrorhabdus sp. ZW0627 TaxID=3039774 RepID=UPI0024369ABF|nr:phosphate ABC transporter permease PstA [Thiomicrorhabdus sp. ZW0627]MDG6774820.1 phosphate ABC transporter permease PstA [Thiomicrorhabdus sp. ZW0627]
MRLLINKIVLGLCSLAALVGLVFLGWILTTLIIKGTEALSPYIFTNDLINNGIRNLLVGQFMLAGIATVFGIPIGIMAGIYLQEYGNGTKYAEFIRDLSDIMISAPSIVIGTFVYAIIVIPTGHTSGWAGIFALFIMMLPIVVRATDDMLSLVPTELREAGIAIGAPKYHVITHIILRAAKVGIVTGLILAFARVVGETAPLLYTSGSSVYWSHDLSETFPSITVSIYNLATMPDEKMVQLAWAAALVLTFAVLLLNLLGRFVIREKHH